MMVIYVNFFFFILGAYCNETNDTYILLLDKMYINYTMDI